MIGPLIYGILAAAGLLVSWWSSRRLGHEYRHDVTFTVSAVVLGIVLVVGLTTFIRKRWGR